ncbi:MAG: hypothetical protein N2253_08475 [Bacteroidia bacterium]|nr:hypothetical protein [Bacteroidia bacterium]
MCIRSWYGRSRWRVYLSGISFLLVSCRPTEALPPAYLQINAGKVIIENDTLLISPALDAWVYPQGKYLSMVEAGGSLPIVPAGTSPILLAGGVRVNGISATRRPYPFWMFDTLETALLPEEKRSYTPIYRYFPDTLLRYLLREDFESPQLSLRSTNLGEPGAVQIRRTLTEPRRGIWAGEVTLSPNSDFRAESTTPFEFPQGEVWAEISLKGNRNLGVGLTQENKRTGTLVSREIFLLLRPPDTGWATYYLDLTPWIASGAGLYRYRLYIASAGDSVGTYTLYLDDIRLITLQRP